MVKRTFDILFALVLLLMLLPVLLVFALLVAFTSKGGAFFRQVRVGRGGIEFRLLKFRTMRPDSEAQGQLTIGGRDPRITSVGYFLRKTKLDELPQLWNVLVGDMSVVGPRPEVPKYVAMYDPEQRAVLSVRPGITGMASIDYIDENELLARSADPERAYIEEVMPAKLRLDLKYVKERNFWLDLRIILATVGRVFGGWR
ncbi:MAG: sugar transferase [Flavobacteriales bacterium]|jgi:lipopolysaccharide/colanic/teichoic acid biosynthesis glycosyltransferase|nr:sugar transferase [Flavobacteriales bacterium]MBK6891774.1 sugar transferase [Flavobacteriales bacterium]MBK7247694.1 sugar transferase [Flavobacteriales bacterium]MBK9060473.1 sugar transferase [Flavobacteriales bacterium]MBK9597059.1 sugar transferase [Flavobacteriales bacterium]